MKKIERISSPCGKKAIEIVKNDNGSYSLLKFVCKYDLEEEVSYEIREYPDPSGMFGDLESAIQEAKYLLGVNE